jgi:hypothetical protein
MLRDKEILMRTLRFLLLALTALSCASANNILNVQVDTSGLTAGGTYFMDFQFIGSDGNTADLSNFSYSGGTGPAGPLEMDDIANFFNEVTPSFTAGTALHFTIATTNIGPPSGSAPDELSFFLLDSSQNVLTTSDTVADAFFYLDITGAQPNIQTFSGSGVGAPILTSGAPPAAAPEPGTLIMLAMGLGLAALRRSRFRSRSI